MSLYPKLENLNLKSQVETKPNQTNMSLSLEIAEKMLIRFDGSKNKLYEFIDNCDKAISLIKPELKTILFAIIETKLTDKARAVTRNRSFLEWKDLKKFLLDAYAERRTEGQWQLELHSLRQLPSENVMSFSNKVENCYIKLLNTLDANLTREAREACTKLLKTQALNVFIRGLHKDISILVKSQNPDSLERAISLALSEEQEQLSSNEMLKQTYCTICKRNNHSTVNCRFKNQTERNIRHVQNQNDTASNYNKNSSNFRPTQNYSQKFCRYCKKNGHLIEECRKREYINNKKGYDINPTNRSRNQINHSRSNQTSNSSQDNNQHLNSQSPRQPAAHSRGVHSVQAAFQPSTSQ